MSRKSKKEKLGVVKRYTNLQLRVMAEYGSSGIWVIGEQGVWRHGMIEHQSLRLPRDLSQAFEEWITLYETRINGENFDTESFNRAGRKLAMNLKAYMGAQVHLEFVPESDTANGLGTAEIIELTA